MPSVDPEYHKKYYRENKEKHKQYCRQKVTCAECGGEHTRSNTTNHRKTKKHLEAKKNIKRKYKVLKQKYKKLKSGSKTNKTVYLDKIMDTEKYAPKGYKPYKKNKTELSKINKDQKLINKHIGKLKKKGRIEISKKKELENFPLGSLVSYVTNEGKYRSGGFLKAIKDEYFVLQGGTQEHPISFCVQFKNIDKIYVKNKETYEDNNDN